MHTTTAEISGNHIDWPATMAIVMGTFIVALTSSIVNIALPKMMAVFAVSTDTIQWVITAYMLIQGIVTALSGFIGESIGYKKALVFSVAIFTLSSLLCGLAWNINVLLAGRVLQAIGGGILFPLGMAMIFRMTPPSQVGLVIGVWGIAAMTAPALGPTLGGYLLEVYSWRLIFYINIPVGLIGLFMTMTYLKETEKKAVTNIDAIGIITVCISLFCLLYALSMGNKMGWDDPAIIIMLFIGMVSLVILVFHELRHPEPILDIRLFRLPIFTLSIIVSSIIQMGMYCVNYLIPILLQSVLGQGAMQTGLILLPAAIITALLMPVSGKLFDKYGARHLVIIGTALIMWGTYVMHRFDAYTPFIVMIFWLSVRGVGIGLGMSPAINVGMTVVPKKSIGTASSLSNVCRTVASSFIIAVMTNLFQTRSVFHYFNLVQNVSMDSPDNALLRNAVKISTMQNGLGTQVGSYLGYKAVLQYVQTRSMVDAIADCFIVSAALCAVGLILSFFFKDRVKGKVHVSVDNSKP